MSIFNAALIGLFALSSTGVGFSDQQPIQKAPQPERPSYVVTMTGYNAVPEQTDHDPHVTASGARSHPEVTAARSRDLAEVLPYGTVIRVVSKEGGPGCGLPLVHKDIGLRVVADSMHSRKRGQIDILFDTERTVRANGKLVNRAVALGVCRDVEIEVVGNIDIKEMPKTQRELRLAVGYLPEADEQTLALTK